MKKLVVDLIFTALLLSFMNTSTVLAEELLPDGFQIPGRFEGNGTHFELNNSEYVYIIDGSELKFMNITLDSSEPVKLVLEFGQETVTMRIESDSGASSTNITISSFLPMTTYHKYEDDYHNHSVFTTDVNGNYTYRQDLSTPHFVFIQPKPSTKFIRDDDTGGDCTSIGTWDATNRTCTLTTEVFETIQIDSDGITLDGAGHTQSCDCNNIHIYSKSGVTIKNMKIIKYSVGAGIYVLSSNNNMLVNNTLSGGKVSYNDGIELIDSSNNTLSSNNISQLVYGIFLLNSSNNTLSGNNVSENGDFGIGLISSNKNVLKNNIVSLNRLTWTICRNGCRTFSKGYGISMGPPLIDVTSRDNIIYNNYFNNIDNFIGGASNNLNVTKMVGTNVIGGNYIGGNFWANPSGTGFSQTCTDADGNGICDSPYTIDANNIDYLPLSMNFTLDAVPPTTTITLSGTLGNNGWYTSDVQATLNANDNEGGSGVKITEYSFDGINWIQYNVPFSITNEGMTMVLYKSTDNAGNVESIKNQTVNIDKTPPTITGAPTTSPNADGWYNSEVIVRFTASDEVSGIDTVTPDTTLSTEGVNLFATGTATDKAGNSNSTTVSGINIDKTSPQITINTPANGGIYILNQTLIADWSATDSLSGIASATGTLLSGAVIDTGTVGTKIFTVTATDNASNTATQTASYTITYNFLGILPPIKTDNSSIFKIGSTVPVKFRIADANGNYVSTAVANLTYQKITDDILGTVEKAISTSTASEGNAFRYDSIDNLYIFNLGTEGMNTGTYQLNINLDDRTVHTVRISLR